MCNFVYKLRPFYHIGFAPVSEEGSTSYIILHYFFSYEKDIEIDKTVVFLWQICHA